jgi:hypothetical protein
MHLATLTAVALLGAAGCGGQADPETEVGCASQALITHNAMTHNALTMNAMTFNGRYLNGAPLEGVAIDGGEPCQPSPALKLMEYTVSCALRPDQDVSIRVDGTDHHLYGQMGLAPEWADQACDETCQSWVSACLIARINARGERVEISMRGNHPALAVEPGEAAAFPHEEAAYYGNLFTDPPVLHACLPADNSELDRVCGEVEDCPVRITGPCSEVCDDAGCVDADGLPRAEFVRVFRDYL